MTCKRIHAINMPFERRHKRLGKQPVKLGRIQGTCVLSWLVKGVHGRV